jgi:thiamine-monophosphate kinase
MVGEFDLIRRYFSPVTRHSVLGGGDDAALLSLALGMDLAVSTDMLVAGRHFLEDAAPESIGHKCLAVNLSDMAAMGASPRWATLSLALPAVDESWIAAFARGFLALAQRYDVDLIGGDTTRGPLNICVQIMGEVPAGQALRREGAQEGDLIWVSGTIGDAALALAHRRQRYALSSALRDAAMWRLDRPEPRVALGLALRGVATSAIDVSDGLLADLGHIAQRSGVAAVLHWPDVPLADGLQLSRDDSVVRQCALGGGDDYELCFTTGTGMRTRVEGIARDLSLRLTPVGRVAAGSGVRVHDAAGSDLHVARTGFDHFDGEDED